MKTIVRRTGVQSLHTLQETEIGFVDYNENSIIEWAKHNLKDGDYLVESIRSNYSYTVYNVLDCGAKWEDVLANSFRRAIIAYVKNNEFNAIYYD